MAWGNESGDGPTPASACTDFHPGPAGRTSLKKLTSVARSVLGPRNAAAIQTTVVTATVASSDTWSATGVPERRTISKATAVENDAPIAATSAHAFTRHQYQRSRY